MEKERAVQIPASLFFDLIDVHVLGIGTEEQEQRITVELEKKLDALDRHEKYLEGKAKTPP
jgi:hypothetical protein